MWVQELRPRPAARTVPAISDAPRPVPNATSDEIPAAATISTTAPGPAPLALTGPVSLQVHASAATSGEQGTAVLQLNSARDLKRVAFTLQFDASSARVLSISAGDFAGVDEAALQYEQPPDGARGVAVRVERPEGRLPPGDAAVAIVAFEALSDSPPRFQLVDVVVTDAAGNSVAVDR